jgi:hypothetical protein
MHTLLIVEQATTIVGRLVVLLMELAVAAAVLTGAIFMGHELREWREWYYALPPAFEESVPVPAVTEP